MKINLGWEGTGEKGVERIGHFARSVPPLADSAAALFVSLASRALHRVESKRSVEIRGFASHGAGGVT